MMNALFHIARPLLFALDPEEAHEITLKSLEAGVYPRTKGPDPSQLGIDVWGIKFANPLAIAAGFDKDARVPDAVLGMGCGFAEIGTTTPLPQSGNPRPRVFRLIGEHGVINRLGFNNEGHAAALARLKRRTGKGPLCINIGTNKESADRAGDYVKGLETFYDVAAFFTINISSPNTPGLRDLQAPEQLETLLGRVMETRARLVSSGKPKRPIAVKIAPDLAPDDIDPMIGKLMAHRVDGIVISNTTLARAGLKDAKAGEAGGLSGRPLFERSTVLLAKVYRATNGAVPLIGVGGIDSGDAALAKIEAGATLLQLYTGLIYEGPELIGRIKDHLLTVCRERGLRSISQLIGSRAAEWAMRSFE
jgi:dihydroorotate dehydrogenase